MIANAKDSDRRKSSRTPGADVLDQPLYSAEAELAVIGSMVARPDVVIDEVTEKLRKEDFFVPAHQTLYAALIDMHSSQTAIDIVTLHQYLSDRKLAEAVGSPGIIAEASNSFHSSLNVGTYIRFVRDKSLLRHLQGACMKISQEIADNQESVPTVLDRAESEIFKVTNQGLTQTTVRAADEIDGAIELIESFAERKGQLLGIPTGFHRLNELTTGWQAGDMIVLAARPGVGKTALALTFARNAMKDRYDKELDAWIKPGYSVGMFSLEMTNAQLMLRLLASHTGISLQDIRSGNIDEQTMEELKLKAMDMKEWPLVLDDSSFLSINQLRGKARRMRDQHGIELLIVDYLQLLRSESEQARDNRQNEVSEISRGIKGLAKELSIPVIVLAQLNRQAADGKAEPALHNLRESGAIEQDADIVMLLHRPEATEKAERGEEDEDAGAVPAGPGHGIYEYILNIAKQRSGPTDKVTLYFHSQYTSFEDPLRHEARRGR